MYVCMYACMHAYKHAFTHCTYCLTTDHGVAGSISGTGSIQPREDNCVAI